MLLTRRQPQAGGSRVGRQSRGSLPFHNIDLSGLPKLQVSATAPVREGHPGGTIEIRLDSPTGERLGQIGVSNPGQGLLKLCSEQGSCKLPRL